VDKEGRGEGGLVQQQQHGTARHGTIGAKEEDDQPSI
jgi:hypothetical protein